MFTSFFATTVGHFRPYPIQGLQRRRERPQHWSKQKAWRLSKPCQKQPRQMMWMRLEQLLAGLVAAAWMTTSAPWLPPVPSAAAGQYSIGMDRGVQAVIICRELLEPIPRYVEEGAWDRARSNVNYCTRTLRLKTALRAVTDRLLTPENDLDSHETAMRLSNDLPNLMTQLDATLYTPIFIASDQGVSPGQRKYGNEALDYLQQAEEMLDRYLELLPTDLVSRNAAAAAQMRVPLERQ